jgi:hypothetical protein
VELCKQYRSTVEFNVVDSTVLINLGDPCKRAFTDTFRSPLLPHTIQDPTITVVGRDSSVGIATRYGLDGSGIESRWGRDFQHLPRPALGPTQPPIQCVPGFFPGGKAAEAWR